MSVYLKLLSACIEEGNTSVINRDVKMDYLLSEEVQVHEFITRHYRRHGRLPSADTVVRQGHRLPSFSEPVSFYLDELRKRFIYNTINSHHADFREAMERKDVDTAVDRLRHIIQGVSVASSDAPSRYVDVVERVIEEYDQRKFITGLSGVTFGWPSIDAVTNGAQGGDVIVLVGRPNIGKSWLLFESAYQAWIAGHSIAIESLEMGEEQMARRFMGRDIGTNPNYIREGKLSHWMEQAMRGYVQGLGQVPNFHIGTGNMKKGVSAIDTIFQEHLPDIVYIDSAYLMVPEGRNGGLKRWEQMQETISQLKQLAVRYDRPIFITVQFNRNVKDRGDKELDIGDIGGSDSVGQDASVIIGARYGKPPYEDTRRRLIIMKQREGQKAEVETNFGFNPPDMTEVVEQEAESLDWMV